jgi:hypothetical protein
MLAKGEGLPLFVSDFHDGILLEPEARTGRGEMQVAAFVFGSLLGVILCFERRSV